MNKLLLESSTLLKNMYSDELGLFCYSTDLRNGAYVNRFDHIKAQRYTINTLAGIWKLSQQDSSLWDFQKLLDDYLNKNESKIVDPGDIGLLLYVLSISKDARASVYYAKVRSLASSSEIFGKQSLQDSCWQLYGLIYFAVHESNQEAYEIAQRCFRQLIDEFVDPQSGFPYHRSSGLRKRFVSFGGLTYYLKALLEYGRVFDDKSAIERFKSSVKKTILLQGTLGEWAWFYDAKSAKVVDWYEVYSVHQEAMAMLFLLPALDLGVEESAESIRKSTDWLFGKNELNTDIMSGNPFFSFRSIRRNETLPREKRFARALLQTMKKAAANPVDAAKLEINRECRSYEIGWILYVWAGRQDFSDFTNLNHLKSRTD